MKHIYWATLVIGTTYLVGWCGWSKWTYLFMIFLMDYKAISINVKNRKID